ncbi:TRAP transporter small permease [Elioraea sp. Yellowstone]|uniref:TRAP transporter small permease n=1 Tax=Elioraea sp. Yellowstone TaxID=2592070 RepID=UPI00114DC063|nr:TRAP transporter small permease subunit [Elioraea sp. Yellowstone]TQF77097.1 TRAP transporter small permease [Elioraea sp. Yellowstone]
MIARLGAAAGALLAAAAASLLVALLATVLVGVAARAFAHPLAWTEEAAQHLLVWTGFVGLVIAARHGSHIRIEAVLGLLPWRARVAAEIGMHGLIALFALLLLREGPALVARNWDVEWVSLPLPSALLYIPVPLAAAALVAVSLAEIAALLRRERVP